MSESGIAKDARGILNTKGPEALRIAVFDAEPVEPPPGMQANSKGFRNFPKSQTHSTSPPDADKLAFDPERVFYATQSGSYLVDTGTHYRIYGRKSPIVAGIKRHLRATGHSENDLKDLVIDHFENIELDRACDWTGGLAGHRRGIILREGRKFLITDEPDMIEPLAGKWPIIKDIITQAFPNEDARIVFLGWLSGGVDAIRKQTHQPAPMLVLAGEAKAGKSLLAHISKIVLGGRSGSPMTAWSGRLPWNDDILRTELLLIDDSVSSTDPRARKAFGASFKEAIYAGDVSINKRRESSLNLRPVWRVMVCCNETPENLSVIPPLEDGIEDKVILLRVSRIKTPMPAEKVDEKLAFAAAIRTELPAFIHYLESFTVPAILSDSRSGVTAWKDPILLDAVMEISPEKRLENLISLALQKGFFSLTPGDSQWMSAAEVQSVLENRDSPTATQAQVLLKFHATCGRSLAYLTKHGSPFVTSSRTYQGTGQYLIRRPQGGEVE
jgi:hypothetical protein